jgi:hypothetical protein
MRQAFESLPHGFTELRPISEALLAYERLQLRLEGTKRGSRGDLFGERLVHIDLNEIRKIGVDR